MKISIITIVRNDVQNIKETLLSCISQTYPDKEIILIDGLSNDGTSEVISKYTSDINLYIREPDKGIYDAMNKGISHANGEWVVFMNSGDVFYDSNSLSKIRLDLLNSFDVIAGSWIERGLDKKIYKARNSICYSMPTSHQAMLIRTDLVKKFKFKTKYRVGADYDLVCRILNRNKKGLYIHDYPFAIVRPDGFGRNVELYKKDYREIVFNHFGIFAYIKYRLFEILN